MLCYRNIFVNSTNHFKQTNKIKTGAFGLPLSEIVVVDETLELARLTPRVNGGHELACSVHRTHERDAKPLVETLPKSLEGLELDWVEAKERR
jgi:hypothetical protein